MTYDEIYNEEYNKAIGNSVSDIEKQQKEAEGSLASNKQIALNKLKQAYENNAKTLTDNKNQALQEAYISKMKEQRDMPGTLARQGLGGGVSETTQASLTRNYQNNRNSAEKNYATNKTSLDTAYADNQGTIESDYNTNLTNLKSSYLNAIANAKQNAMSLALSSASNRYNAYQNELAAASSSASGSGSGSGGGGGNTTSVENANGTLYNVTRDSNGNIVDYSLVGNPNSKIVTGNTFSTGYQKGKVSKSNTKGKYSAKTYF